MSEVAAVVSKSASSIGSGSVGGSVSVSVDRHIQPYGVLKSATGYTYPHRAWIDIVRKGGRRRGYITAVKHDDDRLAVGWSLCEGKDRFNAGVGLDIAFKRGERWMDRREVAILNSGQCRNGSDAVPIPHTLAAAIAASVESCCLKRGWNARLPLWFDQLQYAVGAADVAAASAAAASSASAASASADTSAITGAEYGSSITDEAKGGVNEASKGDHAAVCEA